MCGEYILVGNVELKHLARSPIDNSFVLRNTASEKYGARHFYKLNAKHEKEAVYIQRDNGLEKRWRMHCPRCELTVAYETTDPRDKKQGPYTYILAGALSEEQSKIPDGAFGDDASTA